VKHADEQHVRSANELATTGNVGAEEVVVDAMVDRMNPVGWHAVALQYLHTRHLGRRDHARCGGERCTGVGF
jgi:hypothetical protein